MRVRPAIALFTLAFSPVLLGSALAQSAAGAKPGQTTDQKGSAQKVHQPAAASTVRYGEVTGDFGPFLDNNGNQVAAIQVSVLDKGLQVIGQATRVSLSSEKMELFYTQTDPKTVPAFVLVGKKIPGDHLYPFVETKPQTTDSSLVAFRQVVSGDFCLLDKVSHGGQCTTGLITVDEHGNPVSPPTPPVKQIKAYVQAANGTFREATVNSVSLRSADVSFSAPVGFRPAWLVLEGPSGAHTFAYAPAPPIQESDLVYTADDLEKVCNVVAGKPDCVNTVAGDLAPPKPIASDATASFVALQGKLLVAHIRAPLGLEPSSILVTNTKNSPNTSVIVRRSLRPGGNNNLLHVDMSIMDQVTVDRNFGNRIGKRYLAVTLDVKNPTAQKLQFTKSAIYFDVDYVEAKQNIWPGFYQPIEEVSSLGMYTPSPYTPPFIKVKRGRVFRFGLEQNVKQAPVNYLAVLGSYDQTTEKVGQDFDTGQLLASIMTTIATGGVAGTAQFRTASSLLSGVFLPGLKGIVLNDSRINRWRTNLVAQTLQEVIQVPPNGSTSTIVLLPRTGILAFSDVEIPVMIQRLIDVHLETEIVTEATATSVEKGSCKVGYTKNQARDALGEPAGVSTNADGSSVFTYPKGPVVSASFNAAGSLISCQERSVSDQLAQAGSLADMSATLTRLGLTANKITLTDGSIVLADIPGVQQTFHFDAKGNKAADYTFLFSKIKAYATGTKAALESFLEEPTTILLQSRESEIQQYVKANPNVKAGEVLRYPSPDIQNGWVDVTFKDSTNIESITFEGDKPSNAN